MIDYRFKKPTIAEYKANIKERFARAANIRKEREKTGVITKQDKADLLLAANYKCQKCGSTNKLGIDHVIPLSLGGTNTKDNAQILCFDCNLMKGNRSFADYRSG